MKDEQYHEHVQGTQGKVANYCDVEAGDYFVSVITDRYEGHAMFHVSVAKKLRAALGRAIKHVEAQPRTNR